MTTVVLIESPFLDRLDIRELAGSFRCAVVSLSIVRISSLRCRHLAGSSKAPAQTRQNACGAHAARGDRPRAI